jgi:hypothetical protein
MRDDICEAIQLKRIMRLTYNGTVRQAEPYIFGILNTGAETLSAYQFSGGSASGQPVGWKYYSLAKLSDIVVTGEGFEKRPSYNPDDNRFRDKYCRID